MGFSQVLVNALPLPDPAKRWSSSANQNGRAPAASPEEYYKVMLVEEGTMKKRWPYRKIFLPIVDLLRQGITPEKIALSIALGAVLGIFPVLGSTTILCAAAAFVFRLNLPAIQLVNFLIYPLQLILFLPFLQAGSRITGAAPVTLSMKEVFGMIKSDPWSLIKMLWTASLGAIAIWMVISPLVVAAVYFTLAPVLRRLRRSFAYIASV
jgi:uncharacterized protein (DUF2062 family)